jgi:hypothetical protein
LEHRARFPQQKDPQKAKRLRQTIDQIQHEIKLLKGFSPLFDFPIRKILAMVPTKLSRI